MGKGWQPRQWIAQVVAARAAKKKRAQSTMKPADALDIIGVKAAAWREPWMIFQSAAWS